MRQTMRLLVTLSIAFLSVACDGPASSPTDGGHPGVDAGDASSPQTDGQVPSPDGGTDAGQVVIVAGAPRVLYVDALSGPIDGGEDGQGAYLSIFGVGFGDPSGMGTTTRVLIGAVEVANYRYLGSSRVAGKLGIEQLTVQVGALGGATLGAPLPIIVRVGAVDSNDDQMFIPNAGRILFAALDGDDSSAVPGDITHPWRHLQTASGGVYGTLRAGDHIIIRGGAWSDAMGTDSTWLRFGDPDTLGSSPTGAAGTGWIHITAYPGPIDGNAIEDVHYTTPPDVPGGIEGPWSARAGEAGEYVSVSNLRMEVGARSSSDAAPINLQYTAGHWRVVNNEIGPWPSTLASPDNAKAAGVAGHGESILILGNHIHDIDCDHDALENHGIYADTTAQDWEVAYNWIHDITGGSLIQFHDNEGGMGTVWPGFTGMRVHHNWLENAAKYGINLSDAGAVAGSVEMRAWNNVIIGTHLPPIRLSTSADEMDITYAFNTLFDAMVEASGSGNGYVRNEWMGGTPRVIRVLDNVFVIGPHTVDGIDWFADNSGDSDGFVFASNLYFSTQGTAPSDTMDARAVEGDPHFVDASGHDLRLGSGSAALEHATATLDFAVPDDFRFTARPAGPSPDVGAFEGQ